MKTRTQETRVAAQPGQQAQVAPCPLLALQGGNPRPDCACGRTTAEESTCPDC